ncbi:GATA zinc finger domain-containing protein 14-like isoform X2 [Diachasmimorpha longicaudata]|uniref:GATA zinc finger domain-containing protein 14-like isoform X2 n=1 Tax=Diachasmimorpha longicaudata TaxID=58733 RepID=UPI0030B8BA92
MAKRRSMNRRWSRRSTNNSAILNDDTNFLEGDDDYWHYLNQTNSRPPSGVNITAATAVLDPDSNMMDSTVSTTHWEYLGKSSDNILQQLPANSSKLSKKGDAASENSPEDSSDEEVSVKVRKKRPLLGPPRKPKAKEILSVSSSESAVEPSVHSPSHNSPAFPGKSPPQPDSMNSSESTKVEKRRPRFRKQKVKRVGHSMVISDDSVVLPSQESRGTRIKPRATFFNRSSEKINSTSNLVEERTPQERSASDSDTNEPIFLPRKKFERVRKLKVSENPFVGILDDSEPQNQTVEISSKANKSQTRHSDSGNLASQINSVSVHSQKHSGGDDEESELSISEELKIGRSTKDPDDGQSFQNPEANTIVGQETVIGKSKNNQNRSRTSKNRKVSENANNTVNSLRKSSSVEGEIMNDSKTSKGRTGWSQSSKNSVHQSFNLGAIDDPGERETSSKSVNRSTYISKAQSVRSEHSPSPINSPSISEHVEQRERPQESMKTNERDGTRRSRISSKKNSRGELSLHQTKGSNQNESQMDRSATLAYPQLKGHHQQKEINSYEEMNSETEMNNSKNHRNVASISDNAEITNIIHSPTNRPVSNRHSHPKGQDEQHKVNSDSELDAETVSEKELIFSENKYDASGSEIRFAMTDSFVAPNEKTPREASKNTMRVTRHSADSKASNASLNNPKHIHSPNTSRVKKSTGDKNRDTSHHSSSSPLTPFSEMSSNKLRLTKSKNPEGAGEIEIQRRSSAGSFGASQSSILATTKLSNSSKRSIEINDHIKEAELKVRDFENLRRSDPSLYELPPQQRSPSVSLSESDHASTSSIRLTKSMKRSLVVNETSHMTTMKQKWGRPESDDREQQPLVKKSLSASLSLSESPRHPIPQLISVDAQEDENTIPTNAQIESTPSSGVLRKAESISEVDWPMHQSNFRQLKKDILVRRSKQQVLEKSWTLSAPFNPEEFKKKLKESKRVLERMRSKENEVECERTEKKNENVKKMAKAFKELKKPRKPEKILDRAYIVNGKIYKRPKLPRPKPWATHNLYQFLWKKMEPKFGEQCRVKSEKFIMELNEAMTVIMRRKKYENYKGELISLLRRMAQLGIIETRHDFHGFCHDFLPFQFRIKVVPMLQAGNTHNIPFEPDKLMEPILEYN